MRPVSAPPLKGKQMPSRLYDPFLPERLAEAKWYPVDKKRALSNLYSYRIEKPLKMI